MSYLQSMRMPVLVLLGLFHIMASAQWTRLFPHIEEQGPPVGTISTGAGLMTGPSEGFVVKSTYLSPSSGSRYDFYHTVDDWGTPASYTVVHGGGIAVQVAVLGPHTTFFVEVDQLWRQVHSITWQGGQVVHRAFPLGRSGASEMYVGAVSDTSFFATYHAYGQPALVYWVTPQQLVQVDSLEDGNDRPIALDAWDGSTVCSLRKGPDAHCILRTSADGGANWTDVLADTATAMRCAVWADASTLWVGGDGGRLRRSNDHGASWGEVAVPTDKGIRAIDTYSPDSVWIAGEDGMVMATGDGGAHWSSFNIEDTTIVRIQAFAGAIYAYTTFGTIYRSAFGPPPGLPADVWCFNTPTGFSLLPDIAERMTTLDLFDVTGRTVPIMVDGTDITMMADRTGAFILRCRMGEEERIVKLVRPGPR